MFQVHERTLLLSLLQSEYYNGFGRFDCVNDDIHNKTILSHIMKPYRGVIITFAEFLFFFYELPSRRGQMIILPS